MNHESRLTQPKIKHGGEWQTVDWPTALEYVRHTLECVGNEYGKDQITVWANPMNTVEELYLAKKLADGLDVNATTARLRESDSRLSGSLQGAQWLGQTIEELADNNAVLVVGAVLRKEQPLLTARLRRAAKNGMAVSVLSAQAEELHMPLLTQDVRHPNTWADYLNNLPEAVVGSLQNAERAAIVLGAEVQNHPDYAAIYHAAQKAALALGVRLGILPQAANSVGADVLGFNQVAIADLVAQPKKAVLLLNVDSYVDVLGGGKAVDSLKQAGSVLAFTAYESDTLLDVADVLLPIAPFTETSGSFISMEGRLQSFYGVTKALGDSKPLWKVLRVLGNLFALDGFGFESSEEVLAEALGNADALPEKLNNFSNGQVQAAFNNGDKLVRVGGVGIYHTDPIVRRAASLQQTQHAAVPEARVHPMTLGMLGLVDGDAVLAEQHGHTANVTVRADKTLPENVVHLPHHPANAQLGGLMNTIKLTRA